MGHRVSDGRSVVVTAPAGGCTAGLPYEIDGIFGFADSDADVGESVSLEIFQHEREVEYPAAAAAWDNGDPVYWDGSAFTQTQGTNRLVGKVSPGYGAPLAGGTGYLLVSANAWCSTDNE